jgi:pectinesterase
MNAAAAGRAVLALALASGLAAAGTAIPVAPALAAPPTTGTAGTDHRWNAVADGFAALSGLGQDGTYGGRDGATVTVSTQADLERYATAAEPYIIRVRGSIAIEPYGKEIRVASDKTIVGVGSGGEIVHGGFFLSPGTHNVIIRNLTIRDTYVAGDWDGKSADFDGIQMDTAHHVWIDHCRFERTGDGLVDIRMDSDYVTLSWNVFSDHNKAVGVGWTSNVVTKLTMHHNWFRNTYQRNGSIDNTLAAHLYNNYFENIGLYGTMSRGGGRVVVENSVYDSVNDPLVAKDPASELVQRGNLFTDSPGRRDSAGTAFDPSAYYAYRAGPARTVPALVRAFAGPAGPATRRTAELTVALDGSGDFGSVQAAIGAVPDGRGRPVTIVVSPGTYREIVRIWDDQRDITLRGATGDPADVVITYDLPADGAKFYGGPYGLTGATFAAYGRGLTVAALTLENGTGGLAAHVAGAGTRFRNVHIAGTLERT